MALTTDDKGFFFGDGHDDLAQYLANWSRHNGYPHDSYTPLICQCGNAQMTLLVDDEEGVARTDCDACGASEPVLDSAEYLDDAEPQTCACPCGTERLNLGVAVTYYADSKDVRWVYLGAHCPKCRLVGCYGDWKSP